MIRKYAKIFCWKNVSSFCNAKATHIFSAKNIRILCIESAKTVNEMTVNEIVKLTTLWTTGPSYFNPFMLAPYKRDIGKQWKPSSDTAKYGIWSGSTMFALCTWFSIKYGNKKTNPTSFYWKWTCPKSWGRRVHSSKMGQYSNTITPYYIYTNIWFVWCGLNVAFNNLSVISRRCLDVTGSSMLTFRLLPHWNIMPQTLWHDIPPCHTILTLSWPVLALLS